MHVPNFPGGPVCHLPLSVLFHHKVLTCIKSRLECYQFLKTFSFCFFFAEFSEVQITVARPQLWINVTQLRQLWNCFNISAFWLPNFYTFCQRPSSGPDLVKECGGVFWCVFGLLNSNKVWLQKCTVYITSSWFVCRHINIILNAICIYLPDLCWPQADA